ncbi:MAG: response regulator transcription factor [Cyanobacteria bacterium P01_C01_bin.70]
MNFSRFKRLFRGETMVQNAVSLKQNMRVKNATLDFDFKSVRQTSTPKPLPSLLIADDDPRYREALRAFLEFHHHMNPGWFQQIWEADRGQKCIELAIAKRPSLILLDLEFLSENESGLDIFEQLQQTGYNGKVAIISGYDDANLVFKAMKSGACGYLVKDKITVQLPFALKSWARDRIYLDEEFTTRFFSVFSRCDPTLKTSLTTRESEVLQLLVNGASNQKMADQLYITIGTVKAHLTSIFNKLHVTSRTQAIVIAVKTGLVTIEEAELVMS